LFLTALQQARLAKVDCIAAVTSLYQILNREPHHPLLAGHDLGRTLSYWGGSGRGGCPLRTGRIVQTARPVFLRII
jgi:hypothetical protein